MEIVSAGKSQAQPRIYEVFTRLVLEPACREFVRLVVSYNWIAIDKDVRLCFFGQVYKVRESIRTSVDFLQTFHQHITRLVRNILNFY